MKTVLVCAFFLLGLSVVSGLSAVSYSSANITNQNGEWNIRATTFGGVSVGLFSLFNFGSLTANGGQGNVNADGIFGTAYTALGTPPCVYVSFFDVAAQFSLGSNGATADVSGSKSFLGTAYLTLEEINTAGSVVNTVQLKNLAYVGAGSKFGNNGLLFGTFKGKFNVLEAGAITFTVITSDVLGVLDVVGSPIVTPKSIEVIIEINDYKYASAANHLRLNMGVATGAASVAATGKATLVSGAGNTAVYFQMNNQAGINGQLQPVTVSAFVDGTAAASVSGNIEAQVNAKYGASATFKLVSVDFPAGASAIVYDPSAGIGSAPNSAYLLAPSAFLLVLAFFFAF